MTEQESDDAMKPAEAEAQAAEGKGDSGHPAENKPTVKAKPASKPKESGKPKEQVIQLYESNKRIHPKKAEGRFAKLRIAAILATQFVFIAFRGSTGRAGRRFCSIFPTAISSSSVCRWAWGI
ncbi:cytochrome C oxidase accessory protein CcoG [Neisseria elongata subsp. glycolytica ATCC 29315]|uniref:Cytochrome C oxidase accessory protein CcoG n=1 Tax=Neisseria elongata subsp. glycolytica ATCC 29315 TaxID=546263 RepID=D4DU92_NEIEG|nr:cytochrome C oxidase accessory protein CcoG [Neisseria elongata subsp. glycolytica ATCC 29315]